MTNNNTIAGYNTLGYSDMTLDENNGMLYVHVRFSKLKSTTLFVQEKRLKSICPLYTLKLYFTIRPVDKNVPVFCHLNGYSMTRYQFYSVFRSALRCLNMNVNEVNAHSFKIGVATSTFVNRKSEEIKNLGSWSSTCFELYIRIN